MLAYTALDRLHGGCGGGQAWRVLALDALDALLAPDPVDLLLLDLPMPPEQRLGAPPTPAVVPPVVYVPCTEHVTREEDVMALAMRTGDETVVPMFSAPDRLHRVMGEDAPWYLADTEALCDHQEQMGYDRLQLDPDPASTTGESHADHL